MGFTIFLIGMDLLIPIIMIGFGFLFSKRPPKTINSIVGYRTTNSMKNMETWIFAHTYCGKLWIKVGIVVLFFSILTCVPMVFISQDFQGIISCIVILLQCIALIIPIFFVEKALGEFIISNKF